MKKINEEISVSFALTDSAGNDMLITKKINVLVDKYLNVTYEIN